MKIAALTLSTLLLSGCAAMGQGSQDSIKITTVNDTGTQTLCSAKNEEGDWHNLIPLQDATIARDGNPLVVNCQNDTQTGQNQIEPEFSSGYLVMDLILDLCVISCLIDGGSNAFYDYPDAVYVNMTNR